jgi:hypothetical protein
MSFIGLPLVSAGLSRSLEDDLGWRPFAAARGRHAARFRGVGDLAAWPAATWGVTRGPLI